LHFRRLQATVTANRFGGRRPSGEDKGMEQGAQRANIGLISAIVAVAR
jgi:hypothetical protein